MRHPRPSLHDVRPSPPSARRGNVTFLSFLIIFAMLMLLALLVDLGIHRVTRRIQQSTVNSLALERLRGRKDAAFDKLAGGTLPNLESAALKNGGTSVSILSAPQPILFSQFAVELDPVTRTRVGWRVRSTSAAAPAPATRLGPAFRYYREPEPGVPPSAADRHAMEFGWTPITATLRDYRAIVRGPREASEADIFGVARLEKGLSEKAETLTVSVAAAWPKSPGDKPERRLVRIGDEFLEVMKQGGTTWSVRRGQKGSQARSHPAGAVVWYFLPLSVGQTLPEALRPAKGDEREREILRNLLDAARAELQASLPALAIPVIASEADRRVVGFATLGGIAVDEKRITLTPRKGSGPFVAPGNASGLWPEGLPAKPGDSEQNSWRQHKAFRAEVPADHLVHAPSLARTPD